MDKERSADSLMAVAAAAARISNNNHVQHHHRSGSGGGSSTLSAIKPRGRGRGLEQNYCMSDVMRGVNKAMAHNRSGSGSGPGLARPFPIVSFNHMSREVLDYEASRDFYCGVLGFIEIPRPAFENDGVWLYGFGLSLHLIKSKHPQKRMLLKGRRIGQSSSPSFIHPAAAAVRHCTALHCIPRLLCC